MVLAEFDGLRTLVVHGVGGRLDLQPTVPRSFAPPCSPVQRRLGEERGVFVEVSFGPVYPMIPSRLMST